MKLSSLGILSSVSLNYVLRVAKHAKEIKDENGGGFGSKVMRLITLNGVLHKFCL